MNKKQYQNLRGLLLVMSRLERLGLFYQLQFSERLHEVMDQFSLSQKELAELLGVSPQKRRHYFSGCLPITVEDVAQLSVVTAKLKRDHQTEDSTDGEMNSSVSF